MTKKFKVLIAGAMALGVSTAMADCNGLGLQDDDGTCCVYDATGALVAGEISNISTDADGNITMKCYATDVEADKKAMVYDTDNTDGATCNIPTEYTRTVEKGVKAFDIGTTTATDAWQNVVSATDNEKAKATKTTNSSLICEYVPTGIAYYIDSAVSGINYICGSLEGITGEDGSFTFEVGSSCTFYLGDIELRSVEEGLLEDGNNVYETDVEIARILQSLDTDSDPSNGITIDAEIVTAMVGAGITELPDTLEEMDAMMVVVEGAGGTVVSEEAAAAHILTTLLVGQTYYGTACDPDSHVDTLVFGEYGTLTVTWMESMTYDYEIDGAVLSIVTSNGTMTFTNVEQGVDYILFSEGGKFYTSEPAAKAALDSSCGV